jgi:hypothetical protein
MLGGSASEIRAVRKAQELDQAIQQGVEHIVIVEHLDLTDHPSTPVLGNETVLFAPPGTLKSITVRGIRMLIFRANSKPRNSHVKIGGFL